jgi:outer membrane protein OmpA-like peptidoglycan-associated protein
MAPISEVLIQFVVHKIGFILKIFKTKNMKKSGNSWALLLCLIFVLSACAANKTQKGAAVGVVGGGAMGAVIGRASGNTALGAIIGASVGGTAGALIGRKMDKQAAELEKTVPDAKVTRVGEGIVVEFSSDVLFGFDESDLSSASKISLDKLVKVLNIYPDTDIEIQGHTDSKGSKSYNQNLSERRAGSASNYIRSQGISINRVSIRGFGETVPKYDNNSPNGREENRRVEFLITANEKMKAEAEKEASK